MLKVRVLYTILIMLVLNSFTEAQQPGYEIIMDADYDVVPVSFKRNDDNCFVGIVRKAIYADSTNAYNTFLYKIDPLGDTLSIMFSKEDTIFNYFHIDRLTTEPRGFILTGWGFEIGDSTNNLFTIITRINDEFELIWERTYYFNYYYGAYTSSVLELINGDIIYACAPNLNAHMFIMKLTAQGDSLDFVSYSGDDAGEIWGITYNYDSTAILLNTKWAHYPGGGYLSSVITLNKQLEQIAVNYFPEHFQPPYYSLRYNEDLLLIGGSDQFYGTNDYEYMIGAYLLDTAFNVEHEMHLTNPDTNSRGGEVQAIDYYYLNCIYLGGTHNLQGLMGNQPSWFYITKLNDTLGVEYEKYIGGDDYYVLFSVTAASDGGVLLAGTYQEIGSTTLNRNGLILKLDSTGCITNASADLHITITEAIVYPNPGSEYINIRTALKGCLFSLFDGYGHNLITRTVTENITSIDVSTLKKGNYYYSITRANENIISGTWIKN